MRATKIPEARREFVARLEGNDAFRRYLFRMAEQQLAGVADQRHRYENTLVMVNNTLAHARRAECFHVSPDMTTLVQHAAVGLDDTDTVDFALAPSVCGLVHFEGGGLLVHDPRGATMKVDWVLWGPAFFGSPGSVREAVERWNGYTAWEFNDALDNPDEVELQADPRGPRRIYGRWSSLGVQLGAQDARLGPPTLMPNEQQAASIRMDGVEPVPATNTVRLLHALWLLMGQSVTRTGSASFHPNEKKALRAKGIKHPKVTTIELRRSVYTHSRTGGMSQREYTHRWIVRGHWRWQAHGPGRKERKRIWIEPHVAGPEGTPLVVTDHVHTLRR